MRITKIFVSIFIISFFIGYVSDLLVRKTIRFEESETINPQTRNSSSVKSLWQNKIETEIFNTPEVSKAETPKQRKFEPEIFDITDFWEEIPKYKIQLLEVGDGHRKEDVKAKSGEIWTAFYKDANNYFLRAEKIKVYRTTKPYYIEGSKTVEVSSQTETLVLIKNAKGLRDGKVTTLFSQPSEEAKEQLGKDDSSLISGFVREFRLGEKKYTLRIKQAVNKSGDRFLALVLETGKMSQIVEYCPYFDESDYSGLQGEDYLGNLVWVGDLDRDGKLDLYLDYNTHEKGYSRMLYLSSEAGKGKLIKLVAEYTPTGC